MSRENNVAGKVSRGKTMAGKANVEGAMAGKAGAKRREKVRVGEDVIGKKVLKMLYKAHGEARKGKRKTKNERVFELFLAENLVRLKDAIMMEVYEPLRGICFVLYDPVIREVFAASYRDRIVHHFIYDVTAEWWDRQFIYDSYSCRKGKGTLFGIERLEHHIRSVSDNYKKETYVIKIDIQGYFTSMSREKLYELAIKGLNRQFPEGKRGAIYHITKYLWGQVIFDDPVRGVTRKGDESEWKLLKGKSLFYQKPGRGIVIGNLTSQLLSNILLNELDRFVTMRLGYKHYGRYVDDAYIVVPAEEKEQVLRDIRTVVKDFLRVELGLTLHPKKLHCQEIHRGVEFIGARVYPGYKLVSRRIEKNFIQAVKRFAEGEGVEVAGGGRGVGGGRGRVAGGGEAGVETIVSYLGLLSHFKSAKLRKKAFTAVGFDYPRIMRAWRKSGKETMKVLSEEKERRRAAVLGVY